MWERVNRKQRFIRKLYESLLLWIPTKTYEIIWEKSDTLHGWVMLCLIVMGYQTKSHCQVRDTCYDPGIMLARPLSAGMMLWPAFRKIFSQSRSPTPYVTMSWATWSHLALRVYVKHCVIAYGSVCMLKGSLISKFCLHLPLLPTTFLSQSTVSNPPFTSLSINSMWVSYILWFVLSLCLLGNYNTSLWTVGQKGSRGSRNAVGSYHSSWLPSRTSW